MTVPVATSTLGNSMSIPTLPTIYQQVIHKSRYARWSEEHKRREHWHETVARYCNFMKEHIQEAHDYDLGVITDPESPLGKAYYGIGNLLAMPSMRCLMTAGPALKKEHMCGFNCTYRAIDSIRAFSEIMYVLMCGAGAGFSVERQFTGQLPMIPKRLKVSPEVIVVPDTREGWADSFHKLLTRLYAGTIPSWNTSLVRKKGARLVTMGGYASGPEPLEALFRFAVEMFKRSAGNRLSSLDCHDLVCMVGDTVVSGGVRRSALISLSNPSDLRMQGAKSGNWHAITPWRMFANNSAVYTEKPTVSKFMQEWTALYESKSGERGIINRQALIEKCRHMKRRVHWDDFNNGDADDLIDFGVNPCSEIILRSAQTCNLSEVVARPTDTYDVLRFKASLASMLGTWQATLSNYGYVGSEWRDNAAEERLLGVSVTGIMDSQILSDREHAEFNQTWMGMHDIAYQINRAWAEKFKINPAAAITCVKPSGTVSQLVDSSEGIHSRFAPQYIRRIIMDNSDPICQFLIDSGVPHEESVYKPGINTVFCFPIRSAAAKEGTAKRLFTTGEEGRSALEQLEHWKAVNDRWADHSVSCTIQVDEHEWPEVGAWVWNNFDKISGLSFLPKSNSVYKQMPYTRATDEELAALEAKMPKFIDWDDLGRYEQHDHTTAGKEYACSVNGGCETI